MYCVVHFYFSNQLFPNSTLYTFLTINGVTITLLLIFVLLMPSQTIVMTTQAEGDYDWLTAKFTDFLYLWILTKFKEPSSKFVKY